VVVLLIKFYIFDFFGIIVLDLFDLPDLDDDDDFLPRGDNVPILLRSVAPSGEAVTRRSCARRGMSFSARCSAIVSNFELPPTSNIFKLGGTFDCHQRNNTNNVYNTNEM